MHCISLLFLVSNISFVWWRWCFFAHLVLKYLQLDVTETRVTSYVNRYSSEKQ